MHTFRCTKTYKHSQINIVHSQIDRLDSVTRVKRKHTHTHTHTHTGVDKHTDMRKHAYFQIYENDIMQQFDIYSIDKNRQRQKYNFPQRQSRANTYTFC
jgi:hypothetical protein